MIGGEQGAPLSSVRVRYAPPTSTLSGGDKCLFISGSLGNRPWETEVCRQFSFLPQCFESWALGVQEARRWDAGGAPQREKGNSGLSQWHPCQSHRDSVQTPFRAALTWDHCAWCWSVTGSELPQVRGTFLGRGALGSWGGFSENVQGDHGSRARLLHRALEVGAWEHTIAPITHMLPRNLCGCTCMCAMQPCVYCYVMHVFPETAEDVEGFSHLLLRPRVSPDSVSCTSELHSPRQEWSIHWKLVFRKTNVFILVNRLLIKFPMPCSSSWGCLLQAVGVTHSWPLRPRVMFWTVTNAPQCGQFCNFSSRLWASSSWGQWVIQSYSITDGLFHLLFFYLWLPRWAFLW